MMFAANGNFFGLLAATTDRPLAWLWLYAPAELLSFAVVATATLQMARELVGWLWWRVPVSMVVVRKEACAIGFAAVGLIAAAFLEQVAIAQVW